jgi:hypothetical protein
MSSTTAKDLLTFLDYAGQKGLLKSNTAQATKAAAKAVLGIDGNLEIDVASADLDKLFTRYVNLNSSKGAKALSPQSLETYGQRTKQGVAWFLEWSADPAGWRPKIRVGPASNGKAKKLNVTTTKTATPGSSEAAAALPVEPQGKTHDFIYPLRDGLVVHLWLPLDLKLAEYRRLAAHMRGLVVDAELEQS